MLGRYALAAAVVGPVMLLARLQMRTIAASQTDGAHSPHTFLRTRLLVSGTAASALAASAWLLFAPSLARVVALLAFVRLVEDLAELVWGFLQQTGNWRAIAASQSLHGFGAAIAFAAVFALSSSLTAALAALVIWHLVAFLSFDFPRSGIAMGREILGPWTAAGTLMRECGWLGPAAALVSLNGHLPRLALEQWDSLTAVGVFAALNQVALVGNLALQSLGQVRLRSLAESARTDTRAFGRSLAQLTAAALGAAGLGSLTAAFLGERVLTICFGADFAVYQSELAWLLAASAPLYLAGVWGYAWVALGERRLQLLVYVSAAACGWGAAALWTPPYGLLGAVAAYAVAWTVAAAGSLYGLASRLRPALTPRLRHTHPLAITKLNVPPPAVDRDRDPSRPPSVRRELASISRPHRPRPL